MLNKTRITLLGGVLIASLGLSVTTLAQNLGYSDFEYEEIGDPGLRATMESLRGHQLQDLMYIFYTLNQTTPGFVEIGGYNIREKDTGQIKMLPFYRWRAGPVEETNDNMNIYVDANSRGFMLVQFPTTIAYTRDGRLRLDTSNRLVTLQGSYPLINADGGGPIFVPPEAEMTISASGMVFADGNPVGKIRIGVFTNDGLDKLVTINGSYFVSADGEIPAEIPGGEKNYRIRQGFMEESNILKSIVGDVGLLKRSAKATGKAGKVMTRVMNSAVQLGHP